MSLQSPYVNEETPFSYEDLWIPVPYGNPWYSPYWNGDQCHFNPRMKTRSPHSDMGICESLWQGGKFWFLCQNFRWRACAPVTQGKTKTPIPITIRGVPMPERAGSQKNSHMSSPCSWKEFVTIWGVTYWLWLQGWRYSTIDKWRYPPQSRVHIWQRAMDYHNSSYKCNYQDSMRTQNRTT